MPNKGALDILTSSVALGGAAPIRVSVIGLRGFPHVAGGVETHCEILYTTLARQEAGLATTVYMRSRFVAADLPRPSGMAVRRVWAPRMPGAETFVHTGLSLIVALLRDRPDIVHLHGIGPAVLAPLAKLAGRKVVVTHHSRNYLHRKWGPFARWLFRLGEAASARHGDRVIAVSESLQRTFVASYPHAAVRTVVIAHGSRFADGPVPETGLLGRLGLEPGGYALAYGRLDPTKRFEDIIAAHRAKGQVGPPVLVIAGDAIGDRHYAERLARQAGPDVRLIGRREASELRELAGKAAMTVHASELEGFGLSLLECVLSGVPVIASDIPPFREIGLDEESYFPAGNIARLAALMAAPPPPPPPAKIGEFRRRFSAERMVREHADLFRSLVTPRFRQSPPLGPPG